MTQPSVPRTGNGGTLPASPAPEAQQGGREAGTPVPRPFCCDRDRVLPLQWGWPVTPEACGRTCWVPRWQGLPGAPPSCPGTWWGAVLSSFWGPVPRVPQGLRLSLPGHADEWPAARCTLVSGEDSTAAEADVAEPAGHRGRPCAGRRREGAGRGGSGGWTRPGEGTGLLRDRRGCVRGSLLSLKSSGQPVARLEAGE